MAVRFRRWRNREETIPDSVGPHAGARSDYDWNCGYYTGLRRKANPFFSG